MERMATFGEKPENVPLTRGSTLRRLVWGTLRLLRAWGSARCMKWNSFG